MKFDYVMIGAGLSACVAARLLADEGYKVLILERRKHLGGNVFDEMTDEGILVQRYGPHTFHTSNEEVIGFITKYAEFQPYEMRCAAILDGILTPSPFNFKTIDQFYDERSAALLKAKLIEYYKRPNVTIVELLSSGDEDIRGFAEMLFEKDYSLYTSKQWGISPSEVDPSVLKRVPVELSYYDRYFHDTFEGLPVGGFMTLIDNLLNSPNIEAEVGVDGLKRISFRDGRVLLDGEQAEIVFTGQADELFSYRFGRLPYRSLRFEYETHDVPSYQDAAIVAYPSHDYGFTRITEFTKMPFQKTGKTIIAKEYPLPVDENAKNEPYYPISTVASNEMYSKYAAEAAKYKNLHLLGRLAEFKYYNMDQCVLNAMNLAKRLIGEGKKDD